MAEQLDPEDWAEIMDEAFGYMTEPVERYGGTLGRFMGDAIVAFFGAPVSHEDDPERAVRAGLEIISGTREFATDISQEFGLEFNVRVGINTGPVVVGMVGSEDPGDYTAMGDTVNVAARMEQSAEAGAVQVSESTHSLTSHAFEYESLGGISVKGKLEPVHTYRSLSLKEERSSLRGQFGADAPLVGREAELGALRDAALQVVEGQGQIVGLVGQAGMGKSRMIHELRDLWVELTDGQGGWSEMSGVSFGELLPYGVFIPRIQQMFGVHDQDDHESTGIKVSEILENAPPESKDLVKDSADVLCSLIPHDHEPVLEGEVLQQTIQQTAADFWRQDSSAAPTVLILDDLQWIDAASQELLIHLLGLVKTEKILIVCAFRPEKDSGAWGVKESAENDYGELYTEINLTPLSSADSSSLIDAILSVDGMPRNIHAQIRSRADGNPFFLEEVVRALVESDAIRENESGLHWDSESAAGTVTVPDNVQALVVSRLDRLPPASRLTLQLASVIGRSFDLSVLQQISNANGTLDSQLDQFQQMELIDVTATVPTMEFKFRHQLTRDAAYNSILRRERRRFHQSIAEALEKSGKGSDDPNRLAYHHAQAGNHAQAIDYYKSAAESAARLFAKIDATLLYTSAIDLAEKSEVPPELLVDLYTGRGRVLEIAGDYQAALSNYEKLEAIGRERSDDGIRLGALLPQATAYSTLSSEIDPIKGRKISEQTVLLARELGDHRAEARAYWNLMLLEAYSGTHVSKAVEYGERSVEIAREHGLKAELAYSLNDLVRPYLAMGRKDESLASLDEAVRLLRELDDRLMLADSLTKNCDIRTVLGDFDAAMNSANEALEVSRNNRNRFGEAVAFIRLGVLYDELGLPEKSLEAIRIGKDASKGSGFAAARVFPTRLALAMADAGDYSGDDLAVESLKETTELPLLRRFALGGQAKIKLLQGNHEEAAGSIDEALALPEMEISHPISGFGLSHLVELGVLYGLGRMDAVIETADRYLEGLDSAQTVFRRYDVLRFKGMAHDAQGQVEAARSSLEQACESAAKAGSKRGRWQALSALGRFRSHIRESGDAEAGEARIIVDEIAAAIGDEKLRELFEQHAGKILAPTG